MGLAARAASRAPRRASTCWGCFRATCTTSSRRSCSGVARPPAHRCRQGGARAGGGASTGSDRV